MDELGDAATVKRHDVDVNIVGRIVHESVATRSWILWLGGDAEKLSVDTGDVFSGDSHDDAIVGTDGIIELVLVGEILTPFGVKRGIIAVGDVLETGKRGKELGLGGFYVVSDDLKTVGDREGGEVWVEIFCDAVAGVAKLEIGAVFEIILSRSFGFSDGGFVKIKKFIEESGFYVGIGEVFFGDDDRLWVRRSGF